MKRNIRPKIPFPFLRGAPSTFFISKRSTIEVEDVNSLKQSSSITFINVLQNLLTVEMIASEDLNVCEKFAWSFKGTKNPVTVSDYSQDGSMVAFSNEPGEISVVDSFEGEVLRNVTQTYTRSPVTGCKFHPSNENLILFTCKDGHIFIYNSSRDEICNRTRHLGSNILSVAVEPFGDTFAIACADGSIRLHDLDNLQRTTVLIDMARRSSPTQPPNISSLIYHPEDSHILLSNSNNSILFWDTRTGTSERSIKGTHIHGQDLDMYGNIILTISYREKKTIELWDYGSGKKVCSIPIHAHSLGEKALQINSTKISKNGMVIVAGGSGANLTQAFCYPLCNFIGQTHPMSSPVSTVSVSPFGASFVSGHESGDIYCYMIREKTK